MIGLFRNLAARLRPEANNPLRGMLKNTRDRSRVHKLRLKAETLEDLAAISAMASYAAGAVKGARYAANARRLTLQISRYRHEGRGDLAALGPHGERVSAMLEIRNVLHVRAKGLNTEQAYEIRALIFEPEDDGPGGILRVVCADPVEFELRIDALEVFLTDLSEPWAAAVDPVPPETPVSNTANPQQKEEDAP